MLPPKKRDKLRSRHSKTQSTSLKSQTIKSQQKRSTCGLQEINASRNLLNTIGEYSKHKVNNEFAMDSTERMGKSNSEGAFQRRNRVTSDQVS